MVDHLAHRSLDSNKLHLYICRTIMTAPELLWCLTYSLCVHSRFTFHPSPPCFVCAVKADLYGLSQFISVIVVVVWPFACQLCSANGRHGSDIRMKGERYQVSHPWMFLSAGLRIFFFFSTCVSLLVSTASVKHYVTYFKDHSDNHSLSYPFTSKHVSFFLLLQVQGASPFL